jgi:hypothetical protein
MGQGKPGRASRPPARIARHAAAASAPGQTGRTAPGRPAGRGADCRIGRGTVALGSVGNFPCA